MLEIPIPFWFGRFGSCWHGNLSGRRWNLIAFPLSTNDIVLESNLTSFFMARWVTFGRWSHKNGTLLSKSVYLITHFRIAPPCPQHRWHCRRWHLENKHFLDCSTQRKKDDCFPTTQKVESQSKNWIMLSQHCFIPLALVMCDRKLLLPPVFPLKKLNYGFSHTKADSMRAK